MSDDGKLVFMFAMTHPNLTALGAMRASIPGLAAELGWPEPRFQEAFAYALSKGLLKHDAKASFVSVANFLRHNRPESPNCVRAWSAAADLLPECQLKDQLLSDVKGFLEGMTEGFRKALPQGFAKARAIQEQEQEQELDKRKRGGSDGNDRIDRPCTGMQAPATVIMPSHCFARERLENSRPGVVEAVERFQGTALVHDDTWHQVHKVVDRWGPDRFLEELEKASAENRSAGKVAVPLGDVLVELSTKASNSAFKRGKAKARAAVVTSEQKEF